MERVSLRYWNGDDATDVIGRLLGKDPIVLERRDGSLVTVEPARVIAMRRIPARPLRTRPAEKWRPEELLGVCSRGWVAIESQPDGDWELRASRGFTKRANSAAARGEPADLGAVGRFYAERGLPALAQVVRGSRWERRLRADGWTQVGKVTQVLVKDLAPEPTGERPTLDRVPSQRWLELFGDSSEPARAVLQHHTAGFALLDDAAIARVVVTGEWSGISCVKVAESHRRRGLATELLRRCEAWAAQLADKMYAQVENREIASLYRGYEPHHEYVYLAAP